MVGEGYRKDPLIVNRHPLLIACMHCVWTGMKKLEWNGQQWHEECFKCTNCSTEIGCNSFMPKDNQQYCIQCFNDLFAPKCKACGQVTTATSMLANVVTSRHSCRICFLIFWFFVEESSETFHNTSYKNFKCDKKQWGKTTHFLNFSKF